MLILKSVAAGVGGFTCISLVGWCAFAVLIPVVKIGEYYIGCDMCVPCPGWYTLRGLNYKEICYGTSMYRKHAFRHFPPLCKSSGFCPLLHHLWCKVLLAQSHLKMALIFPVLLTIFLWEGNFLPPSLPVSLPSLSTVKPQQFTFFKTEFFDLKELFYLNIFDSWNSGV